MINSKRRALVMLAGVTALICSPVFADVALPPGASRTNPALGIGTPYTTALPGWAAGAPVDSLTAPMTNDFNGTVVSNVYYLNGANAAGGLGFTYQFFVEDGSAFLVRSSLSPIGWTGVVISDVGSDGSGSSTPVGAPSWSDGDANFIARTNLPGDQSPNIQFSSQGVGTYITAGDYSAVVFFATNATMWQRSFAGLLDSGATGKADILAPIPAPGAMLLGMIGFGVISRLRRRFS